MTSLREQLQQFGRARVTRTKVTFEVSPGESVTVYRTVICGIHTNPSLLYEALVREGVPLGEILNAIEVLTREPNLLALLRRYDFNGSPRRRATDEIAIAAPAPAAQ